MTQVIKNENVDGENERKVLERFVVDNKDLEELERLVVEFNIFEAIGAVRQELRHSDLLAYLLDPSQNHGLDDRFLKTLLKAVLSKVVPTTSIGPIDVDVSHFGSADVRREWRNIDIVVVAENLRMVIAIENKVDSTELHGQLKKYRTVLENTFPHYRRCYLFLTPDGRDGSDNEWISCKHGDIADTCSKVLSSYGSIIGGDVNILLRHYESMLRRHIVDDSPIAELCRAIYREHRKALDLIFEHRPDIQREIADHLIQLVKNEEHLVLDVSSKSYVRFAPKEWERFASQKQGRGWTKTNRVVLFEFRNSPDRLALAVVIGPAETELRELLHKGALESSSALRKPIRRKTDKWAQVHTVSVLSKKDYEDDISQLIDKVEARWSKLLAEDVRFITDLFVELFQRIDR